MVSLTLKDASLLSCFERLIYVLRLSLQMKKITCHKIDQRLIIFQIVTLPASWFCLLLLIFYFMFIKATPDMEVTRNHIFFFNSISLFDQNVLYMLYEIELAPQDTTLTISTTWSWCGVPESPLPLILQFQLGTSYDQGIGC